MDSPGKYLRRERELRNLPLSDAAKFTRVREHYLRAIEEDRYELLPSPVYVKGFLTLYAKYLGVDSDDVIARYQTFNQNFVHPVNIPEQMEQKQETVASKKRVGSSRFYTCLLFVVLFVVALFYGLFNRSISPKLSDPSPPGSRQKKPVPALALQEGEKMPIPVEWKGIVNPNEMKTEGTVTLESPAFIVLEASVGSGIEKEDGLLLLTEKSSEFTCDYRKVYFYTRIMTPKEGKIAHVWLWNGKETYRKEIDVRPPAWSVYSYIALRPTQSGNWNAEVRDVDKVLARLSFKANEPAPHSPSEPR